MASLILCKFPLFSTMELKLAHGISQFILRFKIEIFECGSLGWISPKKKKKKQLGFLNVALVGLLISFPTHEIDEIMTCTHPPSSLR